MYIKGTHCADFYDQGLVYQKVCTVVVFMYRDGVGSKWPPVLKVLKKCDKIITGKSQLSQEFSYPTQKLRK